MVLFHEKPQCREAVEALSEAGVPKQLVIDCLHSLYQQLGADESWTTIKAQNYRRAREMLDARNSKRARLMGPPGPSVGVMNGPTVEQLAEAEAVLCDPLKVPPEYVQRTVAAIYADYGGQLGAWDLMKENDWEAVFMFMLNDPDRPRSHLDRSDRATASGGLGAWPDASSPRHRQPNHTPLPTVHATHFQSQLHRPPAKSGHPFSSHSRGNDALPKGLHPPTVSHQILTPEQRALIEDVDRKAAVLALPQTPTAVPLLETRFPQHFQPAKLYGPSSQLPKLAPLSQPRPNGAASKLGAKPKAGTQLLEPSDSLRNRASLVRKSQEATEEAQKKRRLEKERHAGLCSKAGVAQRRIPGRQQDCARPAETPHAAADVGSLDEGQEEGQSTAEGSSPRHSAQGAHQTGSGDEGGMAFARQESLPGGNRASKKTALEDALRRKNDDGLKDGSGFERAPHPEKQRSRIESKGGRQTKDTAGDAPEVRVKARSSGRDGEQSGGKGRKRIDGGEEVRERPEKRQLGGAFAPAEHAGPSSNGNGLRAPNHEEGGSGRRDECDRSGEESGESLPRQLKRLRKLGDTPEKQRASDRSEAAGHEGRAPIHWGPSFEAMQNSTRVKSLHELLAQMVVEEGPGLIESSAQRRISNGGLAERDPAGSTQDKERGSMGRKNATEQEQRGGEGEGSCGLSERDPSGNQAERVVSEDLSRGMERFKIRCVNAYTRDEMPKGFRYMKESRAFDVARKYTPYLSRLADEDQCTCKGDCLASKWPCDCSIATRGEYAYTTDGRLQTGFLTKQMDQRANLNSWCPGVCFKYKLSAEERLVNEVPPCTGHRKSDFIKECSVRCACDTSCGNRVVQRGVAVPLEVHWMPRKGWGVVCRDALPPGTFACEYVGEILTTDEMETRNQDAGDHKHHYPVELDGDPVTEDLVDNESGLCLDGTKLGNVARFINHRCGDATLIDIPVEIEGPDHNYYHVAFFTTRHVEAGTELTWDYCIDFEDSNHPIKAFRCKCESEACRDKAR